MTHFDVGNGERGRKCRANLEMEKEGGNREREWGNSEEIETLWSESEEMRILSLYFPFFVSKH